jgi:hypothetical protein
MVQKLAFAFLLILASRSVAAQQTPRAPAWGVDDLSTYVVTAWDMEPSNWEVQWAIAVGNGHRRILAGGAEGSLIGVAHLPQGAQIVSIALEACDSSAVGGVTAILTRTTLEGPGSATLASAFTGNVDTPGCVHVPVDLAAPETVENNANRYLVIADSGVVGPTAPTIGAVRIRYRLQVSPPPADASFGDVPTSDPAFQFVEALVASGITAGCGGGNYCPDAPLTRRQMAVFLAKALGLHWPDGPLF